MDALGMEESGRGEGDNSSCRQGAISRVAQPSASYIPSIREVAFF
jgi:hypothetical protein